MGRPQSKLNLREILSIVVVTLLFIFTLDLRTLSDMLCKTEIFSYRFGEYVFIVKPANTFSMNNISD